MSVAGFNKFALLDGLATAKSKATTVSPAPEDPKRGQQPKGGPASRSGRYYARGGGPRPQGGNNDSNANAGEESSLPTQRFDRTEGRHDRGRGRGGAGRGEGRGRGRGGRPFRDDRHSKTNIVDSGKQVSQGWGGTDGNNELAVESAAEKDAEAETKAEGGATWGEDAPSASWGATEGTPAEGEGAAAATEGEKAAPPVQEEDNTITFEEYRAKNTGNALAGLVGSTQVRKANEGAGEDLFAGAKQLLREEEEDDFYVGKPKTQRAPKAKEVKERITIEIDGQFADANSRGGRGRGRGGRGDFRGGRGRGERSDFRGRGGRGGRGGAGQRAVNVDDKSAFPSLG
ncbi:hypothetical protein FRB90_005485 [Tulasnella sp. 427]|nr:hypothetical protein FRB90_005485 [Tulasnella sp. 427]